MGEIWFGLVPANIQVKNEEREREAGRKGGSKQLQQQLPRDDDLLLKLLPPLVLLLFSPNCSLVIRLFQIYSNSENSSELC